MATTHRQHPSMRTADPAPRAASALGMVTLLALASLLALGLWRMTGTPRFAAAPPDWQYIRHVLAGSQLSDADIITVATTIAWLALGYLALTTALRFVVATLDALSGGASWARVGMQSERAGDDSGSEALGGRRSRGDSPRRQLGTNGAARNRRAGADDDLGHAGAGATGGAVGRLPLAESDAQLSQQPRFLDYTVARGDFLWDIARRVYGDGSRFVDIVETNRGRLMPDGERFDDPRLIQPGWVLRLPLPAGNVSTAAAATTYRVRPGDSLWGVAARFLGDGFRWMEIWQANRGREMPDGRRFTDPNLIFPGWTLDLPANVTSASPNDVAPARSPTPTATAEVATRSRATGGATHAQSGGEAHVSRGWEWPSVAPAVLVSVAGFILIGGTAVFVRRLVREGAPLLRGRGRGGAGDAGRVTLATRAVARALADYGFARARPLLVHEAGSRLEFTVECPDGDAEALVGQRHDLERRLRCEIDAEVIGRTQAALTVDGFQRLAAMLDEGLGGGGPAALVVPVGADETGRCT